MRKKEKKGENGREREKEGAEKKIKREREKKQQSKDEYTLYVCRKYLYIYS